jgi:hypothetical protein
MPMTALMPMTMPRLVRAERPRWTRRAFQAIRRAESKVIGNDSIVAV